MCIYIIFDLNIMNFGQCLFGFASLPLTHSNAHEYDIVQQRMLKSIVVSVRIRGGRLEIIMRGKIKQKIEYAACLHAMPSWS